MGILANALVIGIFSLLGSIFRKAIAKDKFRVLGICIVMVSLVGFFENVYTVQNGKLVSQNLTLLLIAFIIGNEIGEGLRLNQHLSNLGKSDHAAKNAIMDSFLFFCDRWFTDMWADCYGYTR